MTTCPKEDWEVLLTVTELTEDIKEGINDKRVFRFKMLPFIAVEGGHPWASNPPAKNQGHAIHKDKLCARLGYQSRAPRG